jgi:hypothetical protein
MCPHHTLAVLLGACVASASAAGDNTVIFQDFRLASGVGSGAQNNMTEAEQTFVLALQGLANRERPRLYLNVTDENMSYNSSGTAWADWIAKHKQLTFVPQYEGGRAGVCRLAQQLAGPSEGIVKGLVLWDDQLHRHTPPKASECGLPMRTLATTIAGLDSLLPVTLTMLRECACLQSLTVVRNLTAELEAADVFAEQDCAASANAWGIKTLLPRTNMTAVFAVCDGLGNFWLAADYAVSQRMYTFSLEPNATVNTKQAALFQHILNSRDTPAAVFGWPSTHEGAGTTFVSKAGCYVMCAATENLGFFASVVADHTKLRLPSTAATRPLNRSRNYVTFQTNEGDTPKSAIGLQHGSWLDPRRGSTKVSWGFNPRLCLLFPVVCEYYAATATTNDSFFSHSSGYMNVWESPTLPFARFAAQTMALVERYMPVSRSIDVWTGSEYNGTAEHTFPVPVSLANYSRYQRDAGNKVNMFTQAPSGFDNGTATNLWLSDGTPVFMTPRYLHYVCEIPYYACDATKPEVSIAQRIVRATGGGALSSPRFAMVYGLVSGMRTYDKGSTTKVYVSIFEVIEKVSTLLPENVEVVTTDEFVSLARAAAPK